MYMNEGSMRALVYYLDESFELGLHHKLDVDTASDWLRLNGRTGDAANIYDRWEEACEEVNQIHKQWETEDAEGE